LQADLRLADLVALKKLNRIFTQHFRCSQSESEDNNS